MELLDRVFPSFCGFHIYFRSKPIILEPTARVLGFKKSGVVERLFGVRYSDFIPEFQFFSADKNSLGGFEHLSTYRSLIAFQSGQRNIFVLQDTPWSSLFVQNAFLQYLILKFPENSKNFKNTRFPYYLSVPLQFFSFLFYLDRKK
ncbi:MAG TPA: hypothetical protein VEP90_09675, partial [Methylomirabilota bacterium]|nr:hypothetical protein [Methylomirabilota bacterium]